MIDLSFSQEIHFFHGQQAPERGWIAGYAAIIHTLDLQLPMPQKWVLISPKNRKYEHEGWLVLTFRHKPQDSLYHHLVFALKYEGINLLFFKKLFEKLSKKGVEDLLQAETNGIYYRKIWFLYEWLMQEKLAIADLTKGDYVSIVDENHQYGSKSSSNSPRHRIKNNLPGVVGFCPLIYKTIKLEKYIEENLTQKIGAVISGLNKTILLRTAAFLLLKDSKASFDIEGETPSQSRAIRWGKAIGQAGNRPLNKEELLRLQQIVIENSRFLQMGFRLEGGFVGEHDRITREPIPEHISARWQDIETLMEGLLELVKLLEEKQFHPVLTAAKIAFGFVFIHPFVDGNGRLHRYLIHHLLAKMQFTPQGIIFPISAAILERIVDYRKVLESYSHPLLDFIKWEKTPYSNIEVLNETIDYYRYFDATLQAEFLFECVDETIKKIIPEEVAYLQHYDEMKNWLDYRFAMPDNLVNLLIIFLRQNNGSLSKRAREKEFKDLTEEEVVEIESNYKTYFEL